MVIELKTIAAADADAVERLLDSAFGADRHMRTAYRLREGTRALPHLSFAAFDGGTLVGSIQCWPVALTGAGGIVPMVLIGPVAVAPMHQRDGVGRRLMAQSLSAAEEHDDHHAMMLIGDPEYYGRFFGFDSTRTSRWRLPGPVEPHRLLARGDGVPDTDGMIGPREYAVH